MRVRVENGKFEFWKHDLYVDILRHGQPWITGLKTGVNAIYTMMAELDAARVVLVAARSLVDLRGTDASPEAINAALKNLVASVEKHDRLVDDREPPSEWTR